jgi:integrase
VRGDGRVYQQGSRWWVGFRTGGKEIREAARLPDRDGVLRPAKNETEARRFLKARVRTVLGGQFLGPEEERLTVAELLDALQARAAAKGLRSEKKTKSHGKALRRFFALTRAVDVTAEHLTRYSSERVAAGRAAATVNRELEVLRHAYRLAVQSKRLSPGRVPYVELLPVDNVRTGFFTAGEVGALISRLESQDLRDFVEWGFLTGMRKGEAAALTWAMLDREGPAWTLRIPAAIAKNKDGRTLPVVGTARTVIERRIKARRLGCEWIFHRESKGEAGQPVKAFDKAWRNALKDARLPADRLFHDLRRSAARNLRHAGASETEAMKVTGHKTASMFRRYSIVTDEEAASALLKQDAFLARQDRKA